MKAAWALAINHGLASILFPYNLTLKNLLALAASQFPKLHGRHNKPRYSRHLWHSLLQTYQGGEVLSSR
jgi:hypothetical protein